MSAEQFWNLVAKIHVESKGDMDVKCQLLGEELRALGPNEVYSFEHHFSECFHRAYSWGLWDAAYLIKGGCSDDSFTDFRSTLISMGRPVFDAALIDPDSLADVDVGAGRPTYEGFQYVAPTVYREITGGPIPRLAGHPTEPVGVQANEWEMEQRFPKLAAKFGHKDSDSIWLKDRAMREAAENERVDRIVEISLSAGIIPPCGLIPPLPVFAKILRQGAMPKGSPTWQPEEFKESTYWKVVVRLENLPSQDRKLRPDLLGVKIHQDLAAGGVIAFERWVDSLKLRGLV